MNDTTLMKFFFDSIPGQQPGRGASFLGISFERLLVMMHLAVFSLFAGTGAGLAEASLSVAKQTISNSLPLARPQWQQPSDTHQVFYLQRDMNRNTIVYAARFDADGTLSSPPISVYWRRYMERGQTRKLKTVERLFAYGVKTRKSRMSEGGWTVDFVALDALKAEMRQSGPFQAALWASINNHEYKLIYGFIDLDESGLITKVERLHLYTFDPVSEKYVTHTINVSGGDIRE